MVERREFLTHTLSNGIRLVHKHSDSDVAHVGLFINTGSRDELEHEHGLAHLIEHMLFKGTKRRRAYHILSRMEDVGGELNAYTTKEETCIHATFFSKHYSRALELISDIAFGSVFPLFELKKEKEIILDEINSYKDSPSELIFDEFEELLFDGNPLARNILGNEKMIRQFSPDHITAFIARNYSTDKMVLSSVGSIPFSRLTGYFERYFGEVPFHASENRVKVDFEYTPRRVISQRQTHQAHCIVGNLAYRLTDERRLALYLLNNYLGGPGMNSRLNLALRERRGLAYTVDSLYTTYSDTGNVTIYFGTDKMLVDKCIGIIHGELKLLREQILSDQKIRKLRQQVLGHLAISAEHNENFMLSMGKSLLIFNKIDSFEEIRKRIESIGAMTLNDIAREIFDESKLAYLIYQ